MCENPIKIINKVTNEEITVSCGKCVLCRRKKCRNWALRLIHESEYYRNDEMCMITLTFSPKFLHIPKIKELKKYRTKTVNGRKYRKTIKYKTIINPGYIKNVKKTGWLVTLFLKKLRKKMEKMYGEDKKFAMFAVGEHGTKNTHRAHWHIIFFGIGSKDLECVNIGKSNKNKDILWSNIIDELWSYDDIKIGKHTISEVTNRTMKYVANYTMKKLYKDETGETNVYNTIMRFSNQQKIGIKWIRRNHKEARKGYLNDKDGMKYSIPKGYLEELRRYHKSLENESMNRTAMIIEEKQIEQFNRMKEEGSLTIKELKKKALKLKNMLKNLVRDTE